MHIHRSAFYIQFGNNIRRVRKSAGLTQSELAASISLSRTSIANIERGRQQLLLHVFFEIASALGVGLGELLPTTLLSISDSVYDMRTELPEDLSNKEEQWIRNLASISGVVDEE